MIGDWLPPLVAKARSILDVGCGVKGSWWWKHLAPEANLVAIDPFFPPENAPPACLFVQTDLTELCSNRQYHSHFDLIVADHVIEHVPDMAEACLGLGRMLADNGTIHVGIPDATMFTDRFYHLIHPEGGGHISKPTLQDLTRLMADAGLARLDYRPWPDNWRWLKECFDWRGRNIRYFSQMDMDYICDVFLRELTPEKGYYYGWEILFRKDRG
jgi:predicted SAM-dependent methyltransferase